MKKAFTAALVLHLSIGIFLLFHWRISHTRNKFAGNTMKVYIDTGAADIGTTDKINNIYQSGNVHVHANELPNKSVHGKHDKLLIVLHNKIQEIISGTSIDLPSFAKVSPANICFTITSDRKITNIQLKKRSNLEQLNKLSLHAVKKLNIPRNILSTNRIYTRYCVNINR